MFNRLEVIGHLGKDVEMKSTPSGMPYAKFNVASTRKWTANGEKKEETTWFAMTAWGKTAELANQYLHKGSKVRIEGRLDAVPHAWIDEKGDKPVAKASYQMTVNDMLFLDSKGDSAENGNGHSAPVAEPVEVEEAW